MEHKKVISTTKGDADGSIDSLIQFLNDAKDKGATHFNMRWSGDPLWAFKWFETYCIKKETKTHFVLDLHYHDDEGQEAFAGTLQQCTDFISQQCEHSPSSHFMYKIVPMTSEEMEVYNEVLQN